MSSKTKIVVLHRQELIYTVIIAVVATILIITLITLLSPKNEAKDHASIQDPANSTQTDISQTVLSDDTLDTGTLSQETATVGYIPGIYTYEMTLGLSNVQMEVAVDSDHINSIRLTNLDETVTTMYPLIGPVLETIAEQIYTSQSLEQITYTEENRYTSMLLLNAIEKALEKAVP